MVSLGDNKEKQQIDVIRDQGTPGESKVTAVESNEIPETNKVTVIAGPYGPTGKWGIYTMFPGEEAPAFPNEKQPEEIREKNAKFWNEHGFLATKSEISSHPRADGKEHDFSSNKCQSNRKPSSAKPK